MKKRKLFCCFDGKFILRYLFDSDRFDPPTVIMSGTKIIEITLGRRIKFIDSLAYFQRSLAELPKLFGFERCKGYYPFLFNKKTNNDYIGRLPDKIFYEYDSMTSEARAKFDKWYDSHDSEYVFDNKKELIEYCRMDVNILRKACSKFLIDFWVANQIDPFVDGTTIASTCNKVFRSKYLLENTIGVLPPNGYRMAENQSVDAIKWLSYVEFEKNIEIQHAGVGRVDGYHHETKTVYEYDGCYWHSCTDCFPGYFDTNKTDEFSKRRDATLAKHFAITNAGYSLSIMRECDFKKMLLDNPAVNELLNNHPMIINGPLIPRDAFYGGRTNATKLYFKADKDTKMHYVDLMSLYPFINKTAKYPIGHPKVHIGDDCKNIDWMCCM